MALVPGTPISTFMNLLRIKRQLGKQWAWGITEEREWEEIALILIVRLWRSSMPSNSSTYQNYYFCCFPKSILVCTLSRADGHFHPLQLSLLPTTTGKALPSPMHSKIVHILKGQFRHWRSLEDSLMPDNFTSSRHCLNIVVLRGHWLIIWPNMVVLNCRVA